jgi:tRNA1Val (adenine37-N6)-methyltransferase
MNEVFYWKQIPILQNQEVLKIGTDAILLGSWMSHLSITPQSILDAGSGTGIISIMMAHTFSDATIHAIDNHEVAVRLTNLNFLSSQCTDRLSVKQEDILATAENVSTYDLVLCNPPFYFNQLKPEDDIRKNSRHSSLPMINWVTALAIRCNPKGFIGMIIPYDLAAGWIRAANETGFYCQIRKNIYSFKDDPDPIRTLILFGKTLESLKLDELSIYESPDQYTKAYRNFTGL